jgi:hypothetical protein
VEDNVSPTLTPNICVKKTNSCNRFSNKKSLIFTYLSFKQKHLKISRKACFGFLHHLVFEQNTFETMRLGFKV